MTVRRESAIATADLLRRARSRMVRAAFVMIASPVFMLAICGESAAAGAGSKGCQGANAAAHDSNGSGGLVTNEWFVGEQVTVTAVAATVGSSEGVTGLELTWTTSGAPTVVASQPFPGDGTVTVSSGESIKNTTLGTVRWHTVGPDAVSGSVKWTVTCIPDQTDPTCKLTGAGFRRLEFTVQDNNGGISDIAAGFSPNADFDPNQPGAFQPGEIAPVLVGVVKNTDAPATVKLTVTNQNGGSAVCDPVLISLRAQAKSRRTTIRNAPRAEHLVRLTNGEPGLKRLRVVVNGTKFTVRRLKDGESRVIDVAAAMRPGRRNKIVLRGTGRRGANAQVLISDT